VRSERTARLLLAALALAGVAVAGYLTWVHFDGSDPVCLAGGGGCSVVQDSEYAELAGVPVPLIGLFGYLTVLLAAALPGDLGRFGGLFAGIVGFCFSLYLTWLELFEIEAICQWCVVSAVLMTLILLLAAWRAWRFGASPGPPTQGVAPRGESSGGPWVGEGRSP
jgi:uncharacterized membrane protein